MAHEFNNILSIVLSSVEMQIVNTGKTKMLSNALSAVERGEKIVKQLLRTTRDPGPSFEVINAGSTILRLIESIRPTIEVHHQLKIDLLSDVHIRTEPELFEATVMNLILNARDALVNAGTIKVILRMVRCAEKEDLPLDRGTEFLALDIIDNGTGIDPQTQDRLFEPFFSTKKPEKGTGLGLSISYHFAKNSGGILRCSSSPNKGSVFSLYLPAIVHTDKAVETESTIENDGTIELNHSILIVDDERMLAETMSGYLRLSNATVYIAHDYRSAKDIVEKIGNTIDILITDMYMPDCTGLDIAKIFAKRNLRPYAILISGYLTQSELIREDSNLIDEWVQKPFYSRDIVTMIDLAFDLESLKHMTSSTD